MAHKWVNSSVERMSGPARLRQVGSYGGASHRSPLPLVEPESHDRGRLHRGAERTLATI